MPSQRGQVWDAPRSTHSRSPLGLVSSACTPGSPTDAEVSIPEGQHRKPLGAPDPPMDHCEPPSFKPGQSLPVGPCEDGRISVTTNEVLSKPITQVLKSEGCLETSRTSGPQGFGVTPRGPSEDDS